MSITPFQKIIDCMQRGFDCSEELSSNPDVINQVDENGHSLLYHAIIHGSKNMRLKFIEMGLVMPSNQDLLKVAIESIESDFYYQEKCYRIVFAVPSLVNAVNDKGESLLYYALRNDRDSLTRRLIMFGANPNIGTGGLNKLSRWVKTCENYQQIRADAQKDARIKYSRDPNDELVITHIPEEDVHPIWK